MNLEQLFLELNRYSICPICNSNIFSPYQEIEFKNCSKSEDYHFILSRKVLYYNNSNNNLIYDEDNSIYTNDSSMHFVYVEHDNQDPFLIIDLQYKTHNFYSTVFYGMNILKQIYNSNLLIINNKIDFIKKSPYISEESLHSINRVFENLMFL